MMTHREKESPEEEIVVTEGVRRTTGVTTIGKHVTVLDPEVPEKKPRRRFTAQYKLRILEEADTCTEAGLARSATSARGPVFFQLDDMA